MDGGTTGDDTSPTDSDTPSEDDGAYFYQVDGGMSRFVYAIETASSLTKIHKQHILTNISKLANNHYLLVFQIPGGEIKVIAQKVIMAIPFSTLRRVGIDDSVGLTELQKRAISELPYGTATKVGIPITGSVSMLYDINLDDKYMAWPGQKAVTVMLGGEAGASCTQDGAEKLVRRLYPSWQARYPAIGEIAATVVKNWSEDPFARGAYSATSTKVDPDLLIPSTRIPEIYQFADPCNNYTFLFAGEHTRADETSAFMEGAAKSGIAAADIIIRRAQSSS
jgi:monoamine oxidase